MASRKPFVSTNVGGVIDLAAPPTQVDRHSSIVRAGNGFLTPLEADPMLDCLEFLAGNPDVALTMGSVGRTFVLTHYSDEDLQADIEQLYDGLLSSACLTTPREARASLTEPA